MATVQQENEALQLRGLLEQVKGVSANDLIREDLGRYSFSIDERLIAQVVDLLRWVSGAAIEECSLEQLANAREPLSRLVGSVHRMRAFDPAEHGDQASAVRKQIADVLETEWKRAFPLLSPLVLWSEHVKFARSSDAERATSVLRQLEEILATTKQTNAEVEGRVKEQEEVFRKAIGQVAVSKHSIHFEKEARRHGSGAWFWLAATVILAGLTIYYVLSYVLPWTRERLTTNPEPNLLPFAIINFGVISLGSYLVVLCGRYYSASRHNVVVNRHRVNALSTFREFMEAAEDADTRATILNRTTEAVFAPQDSGFTRVGTTSTAGANLSELVAILSSRTKS